MKITCDPRKRATTLSERGLDFNDAVYVFAGATTTKEDTRKNYPERRFQTVGFLRDRMVMVVWTPKGEARHIISLRKCNAREQRTFGKRFEKG